MQSHEVRSSKLPDNAVSPGHTAATLWTTPHNCQRAKVSDHIFWREMAGGALVAHVVSATGLTSCSSPYTAHLWLNQPQIMAAVPSTPEEGATNRKSCTAWMSKASGPFLCSPFVSMCCVCISCVQGYITQACCFLFVFRGTNINIVQPCPSPIRGLETLHKLTCTLPTMGSENVDVLNVAIGLEQRPQLLLCDVPWNLHSSGGCS